jgi:hypothetical protein
MAKKKTPINYTSRDFESIKRDLVNHAKRSYPSVYKDFNEASFGSLMLDTVAYIGDIMSFYLDYQANESFMDTAVEFKNVTRHARQYGYKDNSSPSSTGIAEFYITVPANSTGLGPDLQYAPILKRNSEFSSNGGAPYLLIDDVNFENPNNEVIVAKVNTSTGVPISYAIRAKGRVISGRIVEENFQIGSYQRFRRTFLSIPRVAEVLSVFDSDGNEYYEVEHLSQDVIYRDVTNRKSDNDIVPALIRPFSVPRRFTLEREGISSYLQFGYGSQDEASSEADIAEPSNVVLQMNGRGYISDFNFDPSKLIETDKFGVAPVSTSLNVRYRVNKVDNVNAPVGTLVNVNKANYSYRNIRQLSSTLVQQVNKSLEVYNPSPIVGDVSNPTSEEMKLRTLNVFATQNRAVTKTDYEAMVYAMPAKFGAIKRCKITRDPDSFKRNLNLYILSEDSNGSLTMANSTLKDNLKVWLNNIKMINDTIDIIDGKIVNLAIGFKVIADTDKNKYDVLSSCVEALKRKFNQPLLLGESFYITDVYNTLNDVVGVVDTQDVRVKIKNGALYSDTRFNLNDQKSADGRYIKAPDNVSFEIKFADKDIKGTVK